MNFFLHACSRMTQNPATSVVLEINQLGYNYASPPIFKQFNYRNIGGDA